EVAAANSENGLQKVFENLQAGTKYTLSITATDNDERTVNKEITFTTEATPEPTKTYETNTTLTQTITEWSDLVDGNEMPAETVIATFDNETVVKIDGNVDPTQIVDIEYKLVGPDADKLEIVGNEVRIKNSQLIDNLTTGENILGNAGDFDYEVETIVRVAGQNTVMTQDFDAGAVDIKDGKTIHWLDAINGDDTYVENSDGQLYQKAEAARDLYVQYEADGAQGTYLGGANLQDIAEDYENLSAELTANDVMTIKFLPASTDGAPKYLTTKQLQQIMKAVDQTVATNILNNWDSFMDEFGNVLNQLTADDVVPLVFNSGTVSPILVVVKPEKANQLVMTLITNFAEAHGETMQ
ncbi:MAG: hypothetical protein ACPG4W_05570, partial [Flavobacteriales bacterium]